MERYFSILAFACFVEVVGLFVLYPQQEGFLFFHPHEILSSYPPHLAVSHSGVQGQNTEGKGQDIVVKYCNPNIKKAVCGGYSNAVAEAFENHPLVYKIENWSSKRGNHAWNVIILKDGRKLYCDATWYQGNSIDDEGYVVDIPAQNPVDLTFDIDEFNSLGGAINSATGKKIAVHFAWNNAKLRDR